MAGSRLVLRYVRFLEKPRAFCQAKILSRDVILNVKLQNDNRSVEVCFKCFSSAGLRAISFFPV